MKRYGMTLGLRPEAEAEYRALHGAVWPSVLAQIGRSNIRNYSIFLHNGVLFGYMEYHGDNFEQDMERMAADPETQRWWAICEPMQGPLASRKAGEWWAQMEEVFHVD